MNTLDGNAIAGDLREVFATDVTEARFTCAGCGGTEVIARLVTYGPAPGRVARCPHCEDVVLCLVETPEKIFLDVRGVARLELPLSGR